jgi:hypothetical protein
VALLTAVVAVELLTAAGAAEAAEPPTVAAAPTAATTKPRSVEYSPRSAVAKGTDARWISAAAHLTL